MFYESFSRKNSWDGLIFIINKLIMHFSIPETKDVVCNKTGSNFTVYNIYINGIFHCCLRYKQLHTLNEQLKKTFLGFNLAFPSKQLLPLTPHQLEQRRSKLERYIQLLGQDVTISKSDLLKTFLLKSQKETSCTDSREAQMDIYLMNDYKITIEAYTTDNSCDILKKSCASIDISPEFIYYFSLYIIRKSYEGEVVIIKKLDEYEAPFITLQQLNDSECRICIRKCYWDLNYDLELMKNRITLNLLYIQTVNDVEKGWIVAPNSTREQLSMLQARGNKKEYLEITRNLPHYGYLQFSNAEVDYPYAYTPAVISIGNREISMRTNIDNKIQETSFKVTRMRCWRVTTIHKKLDDITINSITDSDKYTFELSFEYLMTKNTLKWITIVSDQAMLLSVCLQSIVDELLNQKYEKQTGDSESPTANNDSSQNEIFAFREKIRDRFSTTVSFHVNRESLRNEAFEVIGDDDL